MTAPEHQRPLILLVEVFLPPGLNGLYVLFCFVLEKKKKSLAGWQIPWGQHLAHWIIFRNTKVTEFWSYYDWVNIRSLCPNAVTGLGKFKGRSGTSWWSCGMTETFCTCSSGRVSVPCKFYRNFLRLFVWIRSMPSTPIKENKMRAIILVVPLG